MDADRLGQVGIFRDSRSGKFITRDCAVVQKIVRSGGADVAICVYGNGERKEVKLPSAQVKKNGKRN